MRKIKGKKKSERGRKRRESICGRVKRGKGREEVNKIKREEEGQKSLCKEKEGMSVTLIFGFPLPLIASPLSDVIAGAIFIIKCL